MHFVLLFVLLAFDFNLPSAVFFDLKHFIGCKCKTAYFIEDLKKLYKSAIFMKITKNL